MQEKKHCDIGFIGLGVMGQNLALNLVDNQYKVACFDLDREKLDVLVELEAQQRSNQGVSDVIPCDNLETLLTTLSKPRVFMLSLPAGEAVDQVCQQLINLGIGTEDIIIDTGNSLWTDTLSREAKYQSDFIFFSTAVSGGEVGARFGPSLMPSGQKSAWSRVEPIFSAIAAKVDATGKPITRNQPRSPIQEGEPCSTYIGPAGSGHFVKMVHNGIEYADMQLICEAYHVLRQGAGLTPAEIACIFKQWNTGVLDSYLMEISAEVLLQLDPQSDLPLVDVILDCAGQKGTGLWTAVSALQAGSPAQTIAQAVFARSLSSLKEQRQAASLKLAGPGESVMPKLELETLIEGLRDALYCAKICAYAQGFQLLASASEEHNWQLDFSAIAKIWRAGCIIRAVFLQRIADAFDQDHTLANLLLAPYFVEQIAQRQDNWRLATANAMLMGIPVPALSSALNYYDAYRCENLPANLLQGQRDFFGAHTFERTDKPRGEKYHVNWSAAERTLVKVQSV